MASVLGQALCSLPNLDHCHQVLADLPAFSLASLIHSAFSIQQPLEPSWIDIESCLYPAQNPSIVFYPDLEWVYSRSDLAV